ncbi:UNVERIFIED_CONTAM: hypothetical protein Sradi_7260000 [Sesamum radiatum]|uniref:Reverse transcriptase domain-containing protein n=1 Tax=Sesamum radiatum TaxID=300843 RepID=A0AAW2ILQ5_SESRA
MEENMLHQRAKLQWLKHGDQNSKIFFRKVNSMRAKQRIFQISTPTGETLTDMKEVTGEFVSYFTTLLGGPRMQRNINLEFLRHHIKHSLTSDEADTICAPVTLAEIKDAAFDIAEDSAPGPDGYTAGFFKASWSVVGKEISEAVSEFFRTGKLLKQVNATLLVLIPKNAFVPGRSISDNILLAQELLAGYNQAKLPPRCTIKVDIQKAYDSVDWDFLTAGLRQGDPMSPYLFVLIMEIWHTLLHFRVHTVPSFQFHWKCKEQQILDLCFADDVLVFCKADIPSISVIKDTLCEFAELSGLKVNPHKSQIILSRAAQQDKQQILEFLGFQEGCLPVRYLGVPLSASRLTIADCKPLIDKLETRIAGWNHLNLTFAGRVQLIRSVLNTLHSYWASVFILPKGIIKILEAKIRKFLWQGSTGRGYAKVAWEQICRPKEEGGLGFRSIMIMNQALMLKHLWKLIQPDSESIWVNWILHYRLRKTTLWTFTGSTGLPLDALLSSVIQHGQWSWPAISDAEFNEVSSQLPPIHPNSPDEITWRLNSGKFTVQSAIELFQPHTNQVEWHGLLQGRYKIPRHSFILWLAIMEKLSTMDKAWLSHGDNGCVFCDGHFTETRTPLLQLSILEALPTPSTATGSVSMAMLKLAARHSLG